MKKIVINKSLKKLPQNLVASNNTHIGYNHAGGPGSVIWRRISFQAHSMIVSNIQLSMGYRTEGSSNLLAIS